MLFTTIIYKWTEFSAKLFEYCNLLTCYYIRYLKNFLIECSLKTNNMWCEKFTRSFNHERINYIYLLWALLGMISLWSRKRSKVTELTAYSDDVIQTFLIKNQMIHIKIWNKNYIYNCVYKVQQVYLFSEFRLETFFAYKN